MAHITALYVYPIKSLGGVSLNRAELTDRGFRYDRRWMLIDSENRFLSQREHAEMALLQVEIEEAGLKVYDKRDPADYLIIPFIPQTNDFVMAQIWDDVCQAVLVSPEADAWFTAKLNINCRLVYMPDGTLRQVDTKYAEEGDITSFSDGYPILLISEESLKDLNTRLPETVGMERFRPNMIIAGVEPYQEDVMQRFIVNSIPFSGVKLCARCIMTTIDQENAVKNKEPLKTLATYRRKGNKILFGQNILHGNTGIIAVGDELQDITFHYDERFVV